MCVKLVVSIYVDMDFMFIIIKEYSVSHLNYYVNNEKKKESQI